MIGFVLLWTSVLGSQPLLETGYVQTAVAYVDQHDQPCQIGNTVRMIVFVNQKVAGEMVHEVFQEHGQAYLNEQGIAIVADIRPLPWLMRRLIALPRARGFSFRLHLIEDSREAQPFPSKTGKITILKLKRLKIVSILYVSTAQQLREMLALP